MATKSEKPLSEDEAAATFDRFKENVRLVIGSHSVVSSSPCGSGIAKAPTGTSPANRSNDFAILI